jgi:hypothetical protein
MFLWAGSPEAHAEEMGMIKRQESTDEHIPIG